MLPPCRIQLPPEILYLNSSIYRVFNSSLFSLGSYGRSALHPTALQRGAFADSLLTPSTLYKMLLLCFCLCVTVVVHLRVLSGISKHGVMYDL
jgi:hypothetical protein